MSLQNSNLLSSASSAMLPAAPPPRLKPAQEIQPYSYAVQQFMLMQDLTAAKIDELASRDLAFLPTRQLETMMRTVGQEIRIAKSLDVQA